MLEIPSTSDPVIIDQILDELPSTCDPVKIEQILDELPFTSDPVKIEKLLESLPTSVPVTSNLVLESLPLLPICKKSIEKNGELLILDIDKN